MPVPFPRPYPMQRLTLSNGCRVAYVDEGSGPQTVVLIHGLGMHAQSWRKNIDALAGTHRCIALDLPGNGRSDESPDGRYSMAFYARCVIDFIGRLGLRSVTLGGHSMGGQVALTAVLNEPRCADRLLLVAPAGFESFSPFERQAARFSFQFFDLFRSPEAALRDALEHSFWNRPPDAQELIDEGVRVLRERSQPAYRAMIEACIRGMLEEPVFSDLPRIRQQALVLFGAYDALIPNRLLHPADTPGRVGERGVAQLQNALLQVVPNAGHFLHWEAAGLFNQIVGRWLQSGG